MTINCVWEHNGRDTLLYAVDFVGAYTRGETLEAAVRKMQAEICSYLKWCGKKAVTSMDIVIIEEKVSELAICDADSDVLFESEKAPLTAEEYIKLKALALKSAQDFLALYDSVPDKNATACRKSALFSAVRKSLKDLTRLRISFQSTVQKLSPRLEITFRLPPSNSRTSALKRKTSRSSCWKRIALAKTSSWTPVAGSRRLGRLRYPIR